MSIYLTRIEVEKQSIRMSGLSGIDVDVNEVLEKAKKEEDKSHLQRRNSHECEKIIAEYGTKR